MNIEVIPLVAAVLAGLVGLGLVFDAWTPDDIIVKTERRRRPRVERSRGGEALIGFGVLCMSAAFAGRDTWRYSVIAVIAGTALLLLGVFSNRRYLGAALSNRGALRRRVEKANDSVGEVPPPDSAQRVSR
jgi:hypothetical protein